MTLLTDAGYRLKDSFSKNSQYIVRTGFCYHLNKNMRVTFGFAHLGFYSNDRIVKREYRPYQDFMLRQKFGRLGFEHRIRIEQRYFKSINQGDTFAEDNYNFRFRYRLILSIPI